MKLPFTNQSPKELLLNYGRFSAYVVAFVVLLWILNFAYQNIYLTVIVPEPVDETEIIARRQKVNLELFEMINEKLEARKNPQERDDESMNNPFD